MTSDEFLSQLREIKANDLHVFGESALPLRADRARQSGKPLVYTVKNLHKLFESFHFGERTIRFVIDIDEQALFGEMGELKGSTPGHDEMSDGLCLTAGVLTFSEDYKTVTGISHESGFFKPSLQSLVWAFKFLFSTTLFELPVNLNIHTYPLLSVNTDALREVVMGLSLTKPVFNSATDTPFASFANRKKHPLLSANGKSCSESYNNLQLGFFAGSGVPSPSSVTETDYEQESPSKKQKTADDELHDLSLTL